ncbi:MAG: PAS domain-containing protein [Actinomycetota bacterium]
MEKTQQRSLVLILARELASNSATPMFVVDPTGVLIFFNEPAEHVLGRSFAETGPLSPEEWGTMFSPVDDEGKPIPLDALPLTKTMRDLQPGHMEFTITGLDEQQRQIAVTAFPLFARANEFVGAVAIFWESEMQGAR